MILDNNHSGSKNPHSPAMEIRLMLRLAKMLNGVTIDIDFGSGFFFVIMIHVFLD
jgi:hypothetical protein